VGHGKKLRMMLEVLGCGLHGMHNVRCGERFAVVSGSADQQSAHERELCCQQGELTLHRRLYTEPHSLFSKRELAADDGVDEKVLHDVRMAVEEGSVETVVRPRVLGREAFQRRARTIADALGEGSNALHKARPHVRLVQHHSRQSQHHIELGRGVHGQILHPRPQRPSGYGRLKVRDEFGHGPLEIAAGNRIEPRAKHA